MDTYYSTTFSHKRGRHIPFEERVIIQLRLNDKLSIRAIDREISSSPTTVSNEIKRSTVSLYHDKVQHYKASAGQETFEINHTNAFRHFDLLDKSDFIDYITKHFFEDNWHLNFCYEKSLEMVHLQETKWFVPNLYDYVSLSLIDI